MTDITIVGGVLVDGSGSVRRRTDIAIKNGMISAIAPNLRPVGDTIDACGKIVAPGLIDIHSHLDAEMFWNPRPTIAKHGVTTVIVGNCGYGFGPARNKSHQALLAHLCAGEGLDCTRVKQSIPAPFESFAGYLGAIATRACGVNTATYVGHDALRYAVMGPSAAERPARSAEISAMKSIFHNGVQGGAVGFSTSLRTNFSGEANSKDLLLAKCHEILEITNNGIKTGPIVIQAALPEGVEQEAVRSLLENRLCSHAAVHGHKITWTLFSKLSDPDYHRRRLQSLRSLDGKRAAPWLQIFPDVYGRLVSFRTTTDFDDLPFLSETRREPLKMLTDTARQQLEARAFADMSPATKEFPWSRYCVLSENHPDEPTLAALAQQEGTVPAVILARLLAQTGPDLLLKYVQGNPTVSAIREMLEYKQALVGGGDSGAQPQHLQNAGVFPTFLSVACRNRLGLALEDAVHMLSGQPAAVFGFLNRGTIRIGAAADVIIFDEAVIGAQSPSPDMVGTHVGQFDQEATGISEIIVNGHLTFANGRPTQHLPGRLVRSGSAAG